MPAAVIVPGVAASPDRVVLDLVGEVIGVRDRDEFAVRLVQALRAAVPSDWVSLNGIAPTPEGTWVVAEPAVPPALVPAWQRLAHQNPLIARHDGPGAGRARRISDVLSRAELHALELYTEVYGPLGVEAQVAFSLPAEPGHLLGVALSRGTDYTDAECVLLDRARPFLIEVYRTVLELEALRRPGATRPPLASRGLTPREAEVIVLVARGRTNQGIADTLGLSVRTVDKHLEHAFRKLGVRSRTQALAYVATGEPLSG